MALDSDSRLLKDPQTLGLTSALDGEWGAQCGSGPGPQAPRQVLTLHGEGTWAAVPSGGRPGRPGQGRVICIHSIYFLPQTLDFLGLGA